MATVRQTVLDFFKLDAIKSAWGAEHLYGNRKGATTSKFSAKLNEVNGRHFTDDEIERLDQLRRDFIRKLI